MQIIDRTYINLRPLYPIERICDPAKALFIDIETTGLKKEDTSLYLIGCGYYTDEGFMTRLIFADASEEEADVLKTFYDMLKGFTHLFHFNGLKFDIPYLTYKAGIYDMPALFDGLTQIDIYKLCKPLRYLLFPESMRQKSIEDFLAIKRQDMYNGGELIQVYKDYEVSGSMSDLEKLITHNREDVLGMHLIMPILYYLDLKDAPLSFTGYRINTYTDYNLASREEVIFDFTFDLDLPRSFVAKTETMYVKLNSEKKTVSIRLPIITDDMKVFFDDYRQYCYLPEEDTAVLAQIAHTLPKERYKKATRQTCYRKVTGRFVKQPSELFTPSLRTEYKDKRRYFLFPDSFKKETADEFGRQLINIFFTKRSR